MSERSRFWVLIACIAIAAVIIVGVSVAPGSDDEVGNPTVQTFRGSGVVCGVVGPNPTRADIEKFAADSHFNADQTRQMLACYGFRAAG
jgi:hypothetical protein